ncbi:MAG: hypothetical protein IJ422_02475 [Oscillospiraceae bacterium]|nr:hypothetical protein [Oscillospiraceae bacterium]
MADTEQGYTSEQCKYRLYQMLRRNFSLAKERERYYTRDFYQKLLDGIEMTEEAYRNFERVLGDEMDYCAKKGINEVEDCNNNTVVNDLKDDLIAAFEKIGITLVIDYALDDHGDLIFTKPDGTVLTYHIADGTNEFFINANSGQEIRYAKEASSAYLMNGMELKDQSGENYQMASKDVYWEYDAETTTMTITGTGPYIGVTKEEQVGSGVYTTLILGAEIPELNFTEAYASEALTTVVLLHPADFPLTITSFDYSSAATASKPARTWDVYTDNEIFKNHAWNASLTINWHTLDEWEG